jgi:hypothetical protein
MIDDCQTNICPLGTKSYFKYSRCKCSSAAGDFVATLWEDVDYDYELPICKGTFDCATDICPSGTKPYCMYGLRECLSAWYPEKFTPT